jgi:hypothetical protein
MQSQFFQGRSADPCHRLGIHEVLASFGLISRSCEHQFLKPRIGWNEPDRVSRGP